MNWPKLSKTCNWFFQLFFPSLVGFLGERRKQSKVYMSRSDKTSYEDVLYLIKLLPRYPNFASLPDFIIIINRNPGPIAKRPNKAVYELYASHLHYKSCKT